MRPDCTLLLAAAFAVLAGCGDDATSSSSGGDGGGGETSSSPPEPGTARSTKARLKFKRERRLQRDVAAALELEPGELCTELGQYDCFADVHGVALGGLRPYDRGITTPSPVTGVTAPLVVERIALSACAERVRRDFAQPGQAAIFRDLILDAKGNLFPYGNAAEAAVETLFERIYLRRPKAHELVVFEELHQGVLDHQSTGAAQTWATLACFTVLTSAEALFY